MPDQTMRERVAERVTTAAPEYLREMIRLRDGIKALITSGNSVPVSTVRAEALRALLDEEAVA